jgi:uncharacterized protein (TIGR02597 family)
MNKQNVTVLSVVLAALGWASAAQAQSTVEITTTPVGMVNVPCPGNADTAVSVSFHREAEFSGSVQSVSSNVITVTGSPAWSANQFVFQANVQRKTYYVLIGSGNLEGRTYKVTANSANTLTVDLAGDTITADVTNGTKLKIIPYSTLGNLFPAGLGVHPSPQHGNNGSLLFMFRPATLAVVGTSKLPEDIFYYFTGAGTKGWRKIGGGLSNVQDDVPVPLYTYFVIRNNVATETNFFMTGPATAQEDLIPLKRGSAAVDHDNYVGLATAVPMTLAQSGLVETGAFEGGPQHGDQKDLLFAFDTTVAQKDKLPSKIYYYYTGTIGAGPGWRLIGGGLNTLRNNDPVFTPGSAYVIRKRRGASNGEVYYLPVSPPYLNQ